MRKALSGYTLKVGPRGTRGDTNAGCDYDGTYNDDWEFTNASDLDECNGMTVNGRYSYYVTDTYPCAIKCLSGTPHDSFLHQGSGGQQPHGSSTVSFTISGCFGLKGHVKRGLLNH